MKKRLLVILLFFCMLLVGCENQANIDNNPPSEIISTDDPDYFKVEAAAETQMLTGEHTETETVFEQTIEDAIDSFVNGFNSDITLLTYIETFTPADRTSSHYRTEFRLGAYEEAIGKSYSYENATVDVVAHQDFFGEIIIRVYMNNATFEQCIEMVKIASHLLDTEITDDEIQETVDYILANKTANGYYYSELGLLMFGNDTNGYEMMIKMD